MADNSLFRVVELVRNFSQVSRCTVVVTDHYSCEAMFISPSTKRASKKVGPPRVY